MTFGDLIKGLPYPALAGAESSARHSDIECEVIGLFEEFRNPLLRYVASFGIPMHDAEEVIQEVFLSLFLHLHSNGSRRNLRGWIFRVAHNQALKRRQANQRMSRMAVSDGLDVANQADLSPNPEQRYSLIQKQIRILSVVDALPETDRRCLFLRAEGLRYRDIATILGISLGSVSISLSRSIARLVRAEGS